MSRKIRGRRTLRERLEDTNKGLRFWGAMSGKPEVAERLCNKIPELRTRLPSKPTGRPLERDVLRTIMQALRLDPRVASVERNQSGVFQEGERYIRVGVRGKLDITVYLKGGRYVEIECKRDERTKPEPHQLARIEQIKRMGGIAGWAWSVESALAILP